MENAPKFEKETTLRVASVNEELISGISRIEKEKKEPPSIETISQLSEIKNISDLKEEIKKLEQKINWTKAYQEHEKHLYEPGQPYVPLITQLRIREQELAGRKKKWWKFW